MSNVASVENFINIINRNNLDDIMALFDEHCFYHNMPMEPVVGLQAIREVLTIMVDISEEVSWKLLNVSENAEGLVFTERSDDFLINGVWVRLPVMGVFEFSNGLISNWRDYYDQATITSQLLPLLSKN